jgi:DNA replication ATP-dependent helicase Dna2
MSLNRFNVMSSRARAKLILFVSRQVVDHLSSDLDILRESRLLKLYVDSFCNNARPMSLGVLANGIAQRIDGHFKWRR